MLTLFGIQLPTFAEFASSTGEYSSGFFSEMLPFAYFIIGFMIGAILLGMLVRWIISAIKDLSWARKSQYEKEVAGGWRDDN